MQYDPIKRSLGKVFNATPILRKLFYRLLDLLLLRAWYIKKELKLAKTTYTQANILDAGAGFGQYTFFMSGLSKKWNVLAVDVKDEQVADCNRFFNQIGRGNQVKFEVADLTQFERKEQFDIVLSVDVMEHILDDTGVFRNFYASMKKGAMLLISTPSDQGGSDVHDDDDHGFIDEHVRDGYNTEDIRTKLAEAGFRNIEVNYTYGKPGQVSWKLSMKYPITILNASKLFFILLPFYYLIAYPIAFVLNYFDLNGKHASGTGLMVKAYK